MTRGRRESAVGRRKKRRKIEKGKNPVMAAVARVSWMFKVKDCHHVCMFCKYYQKCKEDEIQKKGDI